MKIFVTGHLGYIGAHVVELFKAAGHWVTGCDLGLFRNSQWTPMVQADKEWCLDIRELAPAQLEGYDAIVHLAAISNDPMGELDPRLTEEINCKGTLQLAKCAKNAGVSRFLFSSSCAMYGASDTTQEVDEMALLRPLTAYARSKVDAEAGLTALADAQFSPVFLRNATAYGESPMLRLDLVANDLAACALTTRNIHLLSDGTPWRPLVHCKDIARTFLALATAPKATIHNQAFNVGATVDNVQVREVAGLIQRHLADDGIEAMLTYAQDAGPDPRSYRASFQKLQRALPDFQMMYTLQTGLQSLIAQMQRQSISLEDRNSKKFVRLFQLKQSHLLR